MSTPFLRSDVGIGGGRGKEPERTSIDDTRRARLRRVTAWRCWVRRARRTSHCLPRSTIEEPCRADSRSHSEAGQWLQAPATDEVGYGSVRPWDSAVPEPDTFGGIRGV